MWACLALSSTSASSLLRSYCTPLLSSVLCRAFAPYSCPLLALGLDNVAINLSMSSGLSRLDKIFGLCKNERLFESYLRVDDHDEFDVFDGLDSQRPRVLRRLRFTTASSSQRFCGSTRPQFDGLTGLHDLSSIDGLDSQQPRVLRRLRVLRRPHRSTRPQFDRWPQFDSIPYSFQFFHTASGLDRDTVAVVHVTFGVMRHIVGPH